MSSSSTPAPPPAPVAPNMNETSAQAIQAQLDALPKILAAQEQYGSQFSQQNLDSLNEFAPKFANQALKLQEEYAPKFAAIERSLSPELAGAQSTLANFLNSTDDQEYNALKPGLLEDVRSAQSQRGLGAISPLGSIDESVQLQRLRQSLKERRINVALSTAGRVPISSFPQMGQGMSGTGQLIQGPSSESLFGYQQGLNSFSASIFGSQGNIFGNQLQAQTAVRGQNMALIGQGMGALGSAMAKPASTNILNF